LCVYLKRILGYINAGKSEGATVKAGGSQRGGEGFFVEPTIFTEVTPSMKIAREEIFGPVAAVIKFKTEEGMCSGNGEKKRICMLTATAEVVQLANDTAYGLAAAVFTQNIKRALKVAHSLEAGTAFVRTKIPFISMLLPTETTRARVLFLDQLLQYGRSSDDVRWIQDVRLGKGARGRRVGCVRGSSFFRYSCAGGDILTLNEFRFTHIKAVHVNIGMEL
jgi:hypothetical protein